MMMTEPIKAMIDRSLQAAKARGDAYTVASLLNNCGIFEWSPYRAAAEKYTSQLIATTSAKPPPQPALSRDEFRALLPQPEAAIPMMTTSLITLNDHLRRISASIDLFC